MTAVYCLKKKNNNNIVLSKSNVVLRMKLEREYWPIVDSGGHMYSKYQMHPERKDELKFGVWRGGKRVVVTDVL